MFPVFSLVLDKDVKSEVAMLYPELYKDLLKVFNKRPKHRQVVMTASFGFTLFSSQGRPLSFKTFLIWVLISIYQGEEETLIVKEQISDLYNFVKTHGSLDIIKTFQMC